MQEEPKREHFATRQRHAEFKRLSRQLKAVLLEWNDPSREAVNCRAMLAMSARGLGDELVYLDRCLEPLMRPGIRKDEGPEARLSIETVADVSRHRNLSVRFHYDLEQFARDPLPAPVGRVSGARPRNEIMFLDVSGRWIRPWADGPHGEASRILLRLLVCTHRAAVERLARDFEFREGSTIGLIHADGPDAQLVTGSPAYVREMERKARAAPKTAAPPQEALTPDSDAAPSISDAPTSIETHPEDASTEDDLVGPWRDVQPRRELEPVDVWTKVGRLWPGRWTPRGTDGAPAIVMHEPRPETAAVVHHVSPESIATEMEVALARPGYQAVDPLLKEDDAPETPPPATRRDWRREPADEREALLAGFRSVSAFVGEVNARRRENGWDPVPDEGRTLTKAEFRKLAREHLQWLAYVAATEATAPAP